MKHQLVLASTSPRRKQLLEQVGLKFDIIPSDYEEDLSLNLKTEKLVMHLAYGKSKSVADKINEGIVIGADTLIELNDEKIGKPRDHKDAISILKKISGKTLKVYSGIAIIDISTGKEIKDFEVTEVKIKKMDDNEITSYVNTKESLDRAGAFAIQGLGAIFVEKINGSYSNVIGLPLYCLYKNLKKVGINFFDS